MVPAAAVACRVNAPAPQLEAPVVDENVGIAFIVATTAVRVVETQPVVVFLTAT